MIAPVTAALPAQNMVFASCKAAQQQAKYMAKAFKTTVKVERAGTNWRVVIPARLAAVRDTVLVTSVIAALANGAKLADTGETDLVMAAIRRSSRTLETMSDAEIGDYISAMSEAQLRGFANNVKGIYHELAYAKTIPGAALHEATNYPGSDVVIPRSDGGAEAVQLKSGVSTSKIVDHEHKYPGIRVIGTDEQADQMSSVESSGFSDVNLESAVGGAIDNITESAIETTLEVVIDVVGVAGTGLLVRNAVRAAQTKEAHAVIAAASDVIADGLEGAKAKAAGRPLARKRAKNGELSGAMRKGIKAAKNYVDADIRKPALKSDIKRSALVATAASATAATVYRLMMGDW